MDFPSLNVAQKILGTSRKTIATVMNFQDTYVNCPGINSKCRFIEPNMPIRTGSPYISPYARPTLDGIDYSQLPLSRVYAFTEDLAPYTDYANSSEAAEACGFGDKYYSVSRNINNRFVSCTIGGVTISLLFAQNPLSKGGRKPVSCLDTTTDISTTYPSVNSCMTGIGMKPSQASSVIKNYIRPGKLVAGKYLITYITE